MQESLSHKLSKLKDNTVHHALTGKNDSLGEGLVSRSCSYSSESSHPSTIGNRLSSCTRSKCFHLHLWACIKHEARVSPGSFINSMAHATLSRESCSLKQKFIMVNRNTCFPQPHRRHPASKISSPSFPIPPTFLISWNLEHIPHHFHPPRSKALSIYHLCSHSTNHLARILSKSGWPCIGYHSAKL